MRTKFKNYAWLDGFEKQELQSIEEALILLERRKKFLMKTWRNLRMRANRRASRQRADEQLQRAAEILKPDAE